MLAGVLGGIAEYFRVDPSIVRLIYAVFWIVTAGIAPTAIYIAAAMIIPKSDVYNR